jgi:cyanophycinase-like exopeptidase
MSGGWNKSVFSETYGSFIRAATEKSECKIVVVLTPDIAQDAQNAIATYGIFSPLQDELSFIIASKEEPLTRERLEEHQPTGIVVWGGITANYWDALCVDKSWIKFLQNQMIPYAGVSAGSQIASKWAIIDGWKIEKNDIKIPIAPENLSEGLDKLEIREGLSLFSQTIEVHATELGALPRLIHAVEHQKVYSGFAIDDDTLLHVDGKIARVYGLGHVYRVTRTSTDKVSVQIYANGDEILLD